MYPRRLAGYGHRFHAHPHGTFTTAPTLLRLSHPFAAQPQRRTVSHVSEPETGTAEKREESPSESSEKQRPSGSALLTALMEGIPSGESAQPAAPTPSPYDGGARSRKMKTRLTLAPGLPPLPAKPRYPCPHLTPEQVSTYLTPLHLRGWCLGRGQLPASVRSTVRPVELVKRFKFLIHQQAMIFACEVTDLEEAEKHHGTIKWPPCIVEVRTHTHSATLLPLDVAPSNSPSETPVVRPIRPGVTLRDVRVAYLVESAYQVYLERRTGYESCQTPCSPDEFEPSSPAEVEMWRAMVGTKDSQEHTDT